MAQHLYVQQEILITVFSKVNIPDLEILDGMEITVRHSWFCTALNSLRILAYFSIVLRRLLKVKVASLFYILDDFSPLCLHS